LTREKATGSISKIKKELKCPCMIFVGDDAKRKREMRNSSSDIKDP